MDLSFASGVMATTVPLLAAQDEGPVWAAVAAAVIGTGYGAVRLVFYLLRRYHEHNKTVTQDATEQERTTRQDAAAEAWIVNGKLNEQLDNLFKRIVDMETRHGEAMRLAVERTRQCEEDHAEARQELGRTRGRLDVIEAWAQQKGLRIPPMTDGSGAHRPLPQGELDDDK